MNEQDGNETGFGDGLTDGIDADGPHRTLTDAEMSEIFDREAVWELLSATALIPAARLEEYSGNDGSLGEVTPDQVVERIFESDPVTFSNWRRTSLWFREICYDAIMETVYFLDRTVAEITDQFPEPTNASRLLYVDAVYDATDHCFTIVRKLLDEHTQSPEYQGDRTWKNMEEAVVAMAEAGDLPAREYVDRHEHLPEHPGMPYWNGTEWKIYPSHLWGEREFLSERVFDSDVVRCILNESPDSPD